MARGDPVCRKEDCSQYDIGLVFKEISSYSDQDKLKFIENEWKPGELFDFPVSVECSNSKRHFKFVWGWLKRFPWLAYSEFLDGAFCLPCVLFGVQCGRNSNKLDKLWYRNLSIHEFLFVSPTRRHERLYKRRSVKASENKFLSIYFWGKHE